MPASHMSSSKAIHVFWRQNQLDLVNTIERLVETLDYHSQNLDILVAERLAVHKAAELGPICVLNEEMNDSNLR